MTEEEKDQLCIRVCERIQQTLLDSLQGHEEVLDQPEVARLGLAALSAVMANWAIGCDSVIAKTEYDEELLVLWLSKDIARTVAAFLKENCR